MNDDLRDDLLYRISREIDLWSRTSQNPLRAVQSIQITMRIIEMLEKKYTIIPIGCHNVEEFYKDG